MQCPLFHWFHLISDAATDFFTSWGVGVGNKTAATTSNDVVDESNPEAEVDSSVVTTAPAATTLRLEKIKTPTPNFLPNGTIPALEADEELAEGEVKVQMQRSLTATDISCELVAIDGPLQLSQSEDKVGRDEDKFHSLWLLDGSDSFESSIDTSSTSTTIDVSSDSFYSAKDVGVGILHPKPLHSQPKNILSITNGEEMHFPLLSPSATALPLTSQSIVSPLPPNPETESQAPPRLETETPTVLNSELTDLCPVPLTEELEMEPVKEETAMESPAGDLDSSMSIATTAEVETEIYQQDVPHPSLNSHLLLNQETIRQGLQASEDTDPVSSSKVSTSSRATSSISVISEEKDPSSPQISPTSQQNLTESSAGESSPSFEVIPMHHLHQGSRKGDSISSSFDLLVSSSSSQHCPSLGSSVAVIPSLQSTPDRGTPLTHSRSNSNTSSSFDRIEEYNNRTTHKCPGHHFMSSNSSSDIEVIPFPIDSHLNSLENLHLLHRKRKSLAEAETQTMDSLPEKTETKEKVVEMIPAKTASLLAEKDSLITELREEGEKLSKKQFELSTAIKKLRLKEKETDATVKSLKGDLGAKTVELERVVKTLIAKETQEQGQSETIGKLQSENRKQLNTISQFRSELEDAKENTTSMKASLEDGSV